MNPTCLLASLAHMLSLADVGTPPGNPPAHFDAEGREAISREDARPLTPGRNDSVAVERIASTFFDWYIASAHANRTGEFNPIEVEDDRGMTTLDFSKYFANLKRLSFSDSLLERERRRYDGCIAKLRGIRYPDYLKLTDLDQFEALDDDFANSYRWTGGQEMFECYRTKSISIGRDTAEVVGILGDSIRTPGRERGHGREIRTTLVRRGMTWKISDIAH